MPVNVDCPRCKRPLSVPETQAGSYIRCPRCRGRLWVPSVEEQRESPEGPARFEDFGAGPCRPGSALRVRDSGAQAGPTRPGSESPPVSGQSLAAPAVQPAKPATVARFVSAAPAYSYLKLAEDGKLPELRLPESGAASSREPGRAGLNPLVMTALCCLSAVASLALVLMPDDPGESGGSPKKQRAWAAIERDYFSEMDGLPHEPYQFQLREARRARLRGDYRQEREFYRRVLETLRAERKPAKGVTGSPGRDQELEQHLIVLLGK